MRLVTNADFDGVLCAAMIADKERISEIVFAHPKDIEDGLVTIREGDVIANLPYAKGAGLWFDHHEGRATNMSLPEGVKGRVGPAPSAARLVYEYYEEPEFTRYAEVLEYADRFDSAQLTYEEVLKPEGWIELGFTLDPRTGLEDPNEYALEVIGALRKGLPLHEIQELPTVKGRIRTYIRKDVEFKKMLMHHTRVEGNVSITDFRGLDPQPVGNRFLVFALFARCNVNIRIFDHRDVGKVMVAVGKSIFDRSLPLNVGELMRKFGGGGLTGAGTCPLPQDAADGIVEDIVKRLKLTGGTA